MEYLFWGLILIVLIKLYLRQERLNNFFVKHWHHSHPEIKEKTTDNIYIKDLVKLYYTVRSSYNIKIIANILSYLKTAFLPQQIEVFESLFPAGFSGWKG